MDEFILKGWRQADGDNTKRINYDLPVNAVVFDLGGYKGEWTDKIRAKYPNVSIYVFEPVKEFYNNLKEKYCNDNRIAVYNFALGEETKETEIYLDDNCSSLIAKSGKKEIINIRDIWEFVNTEHIYHIDLMKINIEGAEYKLLEYMIELSMHKNVDNIQVQFHDFAPNAIERRDAIQVALRASHHITYEYPFVWENWKIGL